MQRCDIMLRIGGDMFNSVFKPKVTVPEVMLFRSMHGNDSCVDFKNFEDVNISNERIQKFLTEKYGEDKFRMCFPGVSPRFPQTFRAIGIDEQGNFIENQSSDDLASAVLMSDEELAAENDAIANRDIELNADANRAARRDDFADMNNGNELTGVRVKKTSTDPQSDDFDDDADLTDDQLEELTAPQGSGNGLTNFED